MFRRVALGCSLVVVLTGAVGCGSSSTGTKASDTTVSAGTTVAGGDTSQGDTNSVDVCASLNVADVGAIVGGTVTKEDVPGGGCRFPQDDLRAPTAAFAVTPPVAGNGGFEAAISGLKGAIQGDPKDVSGIGDKAVVVVGKTVGGDNVQGSGIAQVGQSMVQVTVIQGKGMAAADVEELTTKLLKLGVSGS